MIIDVIGLFGEPMARSSLVLVVRRQQNKFHVKKGSRMEDSFFFKKRNAGGMFPFFELRPIRQKIVDIASPVHSLHTMNRRQKKKKKKISCKDRPKYPCDQFLLSSSLPSQCMTLNSVLILIDL